MRNHSQPWSHAHPHLTADNRWLIFGTRCKGYVQVHGAMLGCVRTERTDDKKIDDKKMSLQNVRFAPSFCHPFFCHLKPDGDAFPIRTVLALCRPRAMLKERMAGDVMKREIVWTCCVVLLAWLASSARGADRDWQKLVVPTAAQAAGDFANPPPEYGITMWWFWNGEMSEANIRRDLAEMRSRGIRAVMLWPYNGLTGLEYLSPAWFERVRYAVGQARELGMRVWLMDEGCYPSGFVGGKVTRERPGQRMQVLVARPAGQGKVEVKPEYRTSATRYIHAPGFRKDDTYSLFDALDPQATRDFLADVHEQYKKYIGDEFGADRAGLHGR